MRTPLRVSVFTAALAVAGFAFSMAPAGAQALRLGAMQPLSAKATSTAAFPIEQVQYRRGWGGRPGWGGRGWHGRPGWGGAGWAGRPGWGRPGWAGRPAWGPGPGWNRSGWGPGWGRPGWGPRWGYAPVYGPGWGWGPGWGGGWGPGWGYGGAVATGVVIGSAAALAANQGPGPGTNWVAYCSQRYRSYNPRTGTFLGYDGRRHPCP
ncbi:MAG TPA: BA14K family protein [Xanthobacteraceae bacterium]|uniref:BA14K family protein n=1 Tax=Roseixanthobacter finlandensis TaxID=3119922 RepID=UPI0026A9318E|nr:BA14K family protein [Xanthobacteraceae bacterium]HQS48492.1 BA14K family protein [Xanthobacteraceae bacterium]